MFRTLLSLTVVLFLTAGSETVRAAEDKKTDLQTTVAEGKEITLTPVEVTLSDKPDSTGLFLAITIKPKTEMKVKMPAEAYGLGFTSEKVKEGLKVVNLSDMTSLKMMRTGSGKANEEGMWDAEPTDIITHVNGYAVKSVEDLILATSTAKDKKDIQIILKDTNNGNLQVFYVTALKK
jgi:hypothetical protein